MTAAGTLKLGGAAADPAAIRAQSLADGAIGDALLAVERARAGRRTWQDVHAVLAEATRRPLIASAQASLFFGAPAVAFVLHLAAVGTSRYHAALSALDVQVRAITTQRLSLAHARVDRGERPRASEFDLFYGLTGLGAFYLCRDPDSPILRDILAYLVRLTLPLPGDPDHLPGWWVAHDPTGRTNIELASGHGNLGMAHGISGPLALLALAALGGLTVEGQAAAIARICAWLDSCRQHARTGSWWPHWVTLAEQRTGTIARGSPGRPSWCYGTPGLARAQQLAGQALGEPARQRMAEQALVACIADARQVALINDAGLCHGAAGLLHATRRIASDAPAGIFTPHLPALQSLLRRLSRPRHSGLLEGTTGPELVALTGQESDPPALRWDACLLLSPAQAFR